MKQQMLIFVFLIHTAIGFSQIPDSFRLDFKQALSPEFSADDLHRMLASYDRLLSFSSYGFEQRDSGQALTLRYPLRSFYSDSLYRNNIDALLSSDSLCQRGLAFLVIGATGDTARIKALLQKMVVEQNAGMLYWGGMSLYLLGSQETTPMFDLLVQHEEFGAYYFTQAYIHLNKDSILQTALHRIESDNRKNRILAAYSLGFAKKTRSNEKALRKAVRKFDMIEKGYAIISLKQQRIGHLLPLLKPLLNDPLTKDISLEALVESPSPKDVRYVKKMAKKENPISTSLLNCFYKSTQIDMVKYWLYLVRKKTISDKIHFWPTVFEQPLLASDALLPDICQTLETAKDPLVLKSLIPMLKGRTDAKSVRLIVTLLHHPDQKVRYATAGSNSNCRSLILARALPDLIKNPNLRTAPLATMAIENNIDTLQSVFVEIYRNPASSDLKTTALQYLATFPKPQYRDIFREVLKKEDSNSSIGLAQYAALGLGRMNDKDADEIIILSSRRWREGSDSNAYFHLQALEMLKTDKSKAEIEQYLDSKEAQMQEFAKRALENW